MANGEVTISAAALAIALVALLTALGQLLGQYFSTAEGFRRCQKSVMGQYSKKTRRVWRWSEFRFETVYVIPEIFLSGDGAPMREAQVLLTGSEISRRLSLLPKNGIAPENANTRSWGGRATNVLAENQTEVFRKASLESAKTFAAAFKDANDELVCWIPLLHWIHNTTELSLTAENKAQIAKLADGASFTPVATRVPAIVLRQRSWDFQPTDVIKPLAKSTLSDIAVVARRMGMKWKDFRPSDGILRAEGHSHIITSTVVRSLGLVLQYSYTGRENRLRVAEKNVHPERRIVGSVLSEKPEVYIPSGRADRLGCGVIRTHRKFGLPDFTVSTQDEIVTAIGLLDKTGGSVYALKKIQKENPELKIRVADLVALTAGVIRLIGSELVQIPAPSDNMHGVTTSAVGRRAFRACLEEYLVIHRRDVGGLTIDALNICREIGNEFAAWDHTDEHSVDEEPWVVTRDCRYLDKLQEVIRHLTNILASMENTYPRFRYINLLGAHIKEGMLAFSEETELVRSLENDYTKDVNGYFRNLPNIITYMANTGVTDEVFVTNAWVTMMMRAFCWGAMHFFVPGERVPIQYFGSQLPVYIG